MVCSCIRRPFLNVPGRYRLAGKCPRDGAFVRRVAKPVLRVCLGCPILPGSWEGSGSSAPLLISCCPGSVGGPSTGVTCIGLSSVCEVWMFCQGMTSRPGKSRMSVVPLIAGKFFSTSLAPEVLSLPFLHSRCRPILPTTEV